MNKLGLGDTVRFGWTDGFSTGTVCQVHKDGTVDVFRPFVHASDFSVAGSEAGSTSIHCYIGTETVRHVIPDRIKLLRKAPEPR